MRIKLDRNRCEGHGICAERGPDLFSMDDDGELIEHFGASRIPLALEPDAVSSVAVCPVAALALETDE